MRVRQMRKKKLRVAALLLCLALAFAYPAAAAGAVDETVDAQESAGAPPETFTVYVQAGDADPVEFISYTGAEMRQIAKQYNPDRNALKYSAVSYAGMAGRVTTEYITLADFISHVSQEKGTLCLGSGDYIIMGEDLTKDQSLIDSGYDRKTLMGNWYSYDTVVGATRYYFPAWNEGSSEGAVSVPAAIGLKSYGDSSGVSDELLDFYRVSADYLWAYVLYFGQTSCDERTYPYFYYGQDQAIIRYDGEAAANETIRALLQNQITQAETLLQDTVVAVSASTVAQGKFWVTQAQYDALTAAKTAAAAADGENAKNGAAYDSFLALRKACDTFSAARQSGQREGYFWYTENQGDTYTITSARQLIELGKLVSGEALDAGTQQNLPQDSFAGKTVRLACDIDLSGYRVNIGSSEYAFAGTFDGQGYTVSGLGTTYSSKTCVGLFGNIGAGGLVKDLTVSGDVGVTGTSSSIGGIAGKNAGTIENVRCLVDVAAAKSSRVGGIAGENSGTIRNCLFAGTVQAKEQGGAAAGYNTGSVTGCLNAAEVSLVGSNDAAGSIRGCISTRAKLADANSGALAGSYTLAAAAVDTNSGTVRNVFCSGKSTGVEGVTAIGTAAGFAENAVYQALCADGSFQSVSGGYPCLRWQKVYDVYFALGLDNNTMEPAQAGEYLPVIRTADPTAKQLVDGAVQDDPRFVFRGWYADEARETAFDFTQPTTGTQTLYAGWTDAAGETMHRLRIQVVRHTADGLKTTTKDYYHPAGDSYSHTLEQNDGYITETPTVSGVMGAADETIEVHFYRLGDVDQDGKITAADAMLVLRQNAGYTTLTAIQQRLADCNGDDKVNSDDARAILCASVGAAN